VSAYQKITYARRDFHEDWLDRVQYKGEANTAARRRERWVEFVEGLRAMGLISDGLARGFTFRGPGI